MNRIGSMSNCGEGGEDPARFVKLENGDDPSDGVKQVSTARFGVTSNYLVNGRELQIKCAQGAKPGEGGHLPGAKVFPEIGKTRHSTPGVALISPPPHHDIYSIEDLSELIFDLKNANKDADISVKLTAGSGIGTIAAGVVKAKADGITISGFDGGTGASPRSSMRHAGIPWELGLAEVQQTLLLNKLRDRVRIEVDGKILTGRDVAIAAMFGAELFAFGTGPLIALGCHMLRVCNLNTCPFGICTQNETLRKRFSGKPEYVINYLKYVAQDLREIMARTEVGHRCLHRQKHNIGETLDMSKLVRMCKPALDCKKTIRARLRIQNTNRVTGTILGSEITRRYGEEGLPEDTIKLSFVGSAGQSFGAFIPKGLTLSLEGDANDYLGKGLSGGRLMVFPPREVSFAAEANVIIGNVACFGATGGEVYINGQAGERFCVRNSGATAVVEGIGNHGCEYMTGGRAVILGKIGRNFAAGMSGGVAYVLDMQPELCNRDLVELEKLEDVERHLEFTGSPLAKRLLDTWEDTVQRFTKVIPREYKAMMQNIARFKAEGHSDAEARRLAFMEGNG